MDRIKNAAMRFMKDYAWRAKILLMLSIAADAAFFLFYTVAFLLKGRDLWYFFMLCFYLTLTLARVTLYLLYRKDAGREEHEYPFLVAVGSALAVVGLEVCALAVSAYVNGTLITLSNAAVITNTVLAVIANGFLYNTIRFVVKFIVPFTGRRHMKNRSVESEFFRCKKYLSRAESLFMLMLLINRLLARQNPSLTPVQSALHLVVFLAAGAYAIISGMMLFFRANKRKKDETLTENR